MDSYQWLASEASKKGLKLWPTPPKFHVLWHVVRDLALLPNPVHIQNDKEESFLGVLKLFARQCSRLRSAVARSRWHVHAGGATGALRGRQEARQAGTKRAVQRGRASGKLRHARAGTRPWAHRGAAHLGPLPPCAGLALGRRRALRPRGDGARARALRRLPLSVCPSVVCSSAGLFGRSMSAVFPLAFAAVRVACLFAFLPAFLLPPSGSSFHPSRFPSWLPRLLVGLPCVLARLRTCAVLCACTPTYLFACLPACLPASCSPACLACLPACPSVRPSARPSVRPTVRPSVRPSVCLSVRLPGPFVCFFCDPSFVMFVGQPMCVLSV